MLNGYLGNKKITRIFIPPSDIDSAYIKKGIENPHIWDLSRVQDGWVIIEEYITHLHKWTYLTIRALSQFDGFPLT
tara:strand:- start:1109 stop:1336 length:228 start_codon:yes stop_codon:yes gene_type:complete